MNREKKCFQINKTIENSDGIISIRDLNGNTISGDYTFPCKC